MSKGGEQVLLNHREEVPGDHVANDVILQSLGITETRCMDFKITLWEQ